MGRWKVTLSKSVWDEKYFGKIQSALTQNKKLEWLPRQQDWEITLEGRIQNVKAHKVPPGTPCARTLWILGVRNNDTFGHTTSQGLRFPQKSYWRTCSTLKPSKRKTWVLGTRGLHSGQRPGPSQTKWRGTALHLAAKMQWIEAAVSVLREPHTRQQCGVKIQNQVCGKLRGRWKEYQDTVTFREHMKLARSTVTRQKIAGPLA